MPTSTQPSASTKRLIVGIAGRIGSGKTTAAEYLVRAHNFKYLRYSQVLAEWLGTSPDDKARLQELGWEVMGGDMQKDLNNRLISQIEPSQSYVIDGLRHRIDYDSLRLQFDSEFHLLFIDSPADIRWKRLAKRFENFLDFQRADAHPVEQQISALEHLSEIRLDDSGAETNLFQQMEVALKQIQQGNRQ